MEKKAGAANRMSFKDLLLTGIGLTIGAGVVSTVGPAIGVTGRSAWLAYMAAIVAGMLTVIPFAFFASTFRVKGGNYTCIRNCLGENIGGIYACSSILMGLNFATFAIACGQYINGIVPAVNAKLVAAVVLIVFWLLNMLGLNVFVKVQSVMSYVLLAALLAFGVYGLFRLDGAVFDFTSPEFLTGGGKGFVQAATMFMFSTVAYQCLLNFSGNAQNPKRDIPRAMVGTVIAIGIVYALVSITACGVLPVEEVAGKTLTVVAEKMWGRPLAVVFVLAGPLMALFTTLNGNFANMAAPQLAAARDGWWPSFFGEPRRTVPRGWCIPSVS